MGQYFTPVIVNAAAQVVAALDPSEYGSGLKLFGHSRMEAPLMRAVELLLTTDGGARLVWAGDYAGEEPGTEANLYFSTQERHFVRFEGLVEPEITPTVRGISALSPAARRYVVNLDRGEFYDNAALPTDEFSHNRTPLPALTFEGYEGQRGPWARQRIYVTASRPAMRQICALEWLSPALPIT